MSLTPKRSVFQILGCLMQKPSLLEDEKYRLTREDFIEEKGSSFYVIIFAAINNLYQEEIEVIDLMMIDSFLSNYDVQYKIFNDNNGIEYLQNAIEQSNLSNFDYNYNYLKKFSLLRAYKSQGFSIKEIYDENVVDPKEQEAMMEKFNKLSIEEIIEVFEKKQIEIRNMFFTDSNKVTQHAAQGAAELIERFKQAPDYGVSLIGNLQNTIFRGAKLKTVTLRSAPQNTGKTRIALAEAADLAIDELYDPEKGRWVTNNNPENVLYISSEMEAELLQPTILAYISAVPEEKIKDGLCSDEEYLRVKKAIEVLARSNFWIEYVPDFNTQLIETIIKTHIIENKAQYIFFDYIHISVRILEEMANMSKGMSMREDMVLFMFMFRLVQIAERYNVYIKTSSQLNGEWKNAKDADQNLLRGAKSLADKIQMGLIALVPTKQDLEAIDPILRNGFYPEPNIVYHIYKNRMTKYKNIKLWLYIDYDTMRVHELFATTNDYQLINIQPTELKTKKFDF
ncbi:DnaB-like helicase C-terminal domain-containing protein [Brevibacillus brevis]|uniref:DnaB-like helicase C-terminal domain-containing protein n=1 Tax=Brevibacillus brevis TaxID=1393 RepID=UPI0007D8BC50|nr:DnaB-like helicase C-terminal domain-containing protein [Brevibacillus brevis]